MISGVRPVLEASLLGRQLHDWHKRTLDVMMGKQNW
jgi:hypothetical protein